MNSSEIKTFISDIEIKLRGQLSSIKDLKGLEDFRVQALGKKSELYSVLRNIGELPPEERKLAGENVNKLKNTLEQEISVLS